MPQSVVLFRFVTDESRMATYLLPVGQSVSALDSFNGHWPRYFRSTNFALLCVLDRDRFVVLICDLNSLSMSRQLVENWRNFTPSCQADGGL